MTQKNKIIDNPNNIKQLKLFGKKTLDSLIEDGYLHKLITSSEKSSLKKLSDEPTKNKYIDIPHIDMFEKEKNFLEIQNNIHHYNRHYFLEQEHKKLGESFTFEKYKNLREHT